MTLSLQSAISGVMEERIQNIMAKISFSKRQLFEEFLNACLYIVNEPDSNPKYETVMFRLDLFFKGFSAFINERGKDKKYEAGVEALYLICEELDINVDEKECFVLFHMRNLGKFKIRESKLYEELLREWQNYKHYKIDDDQFVHSLKNMMRKNLISYRKRNLQLNQTVRTVYRL